MISYVGIFWIIPDNEGIPYLLFDKTLYSEAESYGDCLTHSKGHYEYWSELSGLGADVLSKKSVPLTLLSYEYEDFPRGRIVYRVTDKCFVIYADHKLFKRRFIDKIIKEFCLSDKNKILCMSDIHYCSTEQVPHT